MSRKRWLRIGFALFGLAMVSLMATACGSSSSSSGTETSSGTTGGSTAASAEPSESSSSESSYAGSETKFYEPFPTPQKKAGTPFKVGYLQISGSIPLLATIESGAIEEAENLDGSVVSVDAEVDPQKQAAGFEQLLAQKVDVIVGYPVVAKALAPQLAKAEAAGIPVILTASQADPTKPLEPGIRADVSNGYDFVAYENMKALSEKEPGGKFVTMGLAAPVESLEYYVSRFKYWGEKFGLEFLGEIDTKEDDPEGYAAAANAILSKYPEATMIATYSDLAGLSTSTVVEQSGREVLIAAGNGASQADIEAVKAGHIFSIYAPPWHGFGAEMVRGAYDAVTKQGTLPERTVSPLPEEGVLVTAENADEVQPSIEG